MVKLMTNPTYADLYKNRFVELLNGPLNCANMIPHLDSIVAVMTPEMQRHCTKWNASFTQWQTNVNTFRNNLLGRCAVIVAGLDTCLDLKPQYLSVNVQPAGAGSVKLDANTLSPYVWKQYVRADSSYVLRAIPANSNWTFDHWEKQEILNIMTPSMTSDSVTYDFHIEDSVIAYFVYNNPDSVKMSFNANPVAGGTVSLQGTQIPTYPYTTTLNKNNSYQILAQPNSGWYFNGWTKQNGSTVISPDAMTANASFTYGAQDTLVANFVFNPDSLALTFMVDPLGSPNGINLAGNSIQTFPYTVTLDRNNSYGLIAEPGSGWIFDNWTKNRDSTLISPDLLTANSLLQFRTTDTITGYFHFDPDTLEVTFDVIPPNTGKISVNGSVIPTYPAALQLDRREMYNIVAIPNQIFDFVNWTKANSTSTINPDSLNTEVRYTFKTSDHVKAYFEAIPPVDETFTVVTAFSPNGDGTNDYFGILSAPNATKVELSVFNRWGQRIWHTKNKTDKWDGTANGDYLELGTYYWTAEATFQNKGYSKKKRLKGEVLILH